MNRSLIPFLLTFVFVGFPLHSQSIDYSILDQYIAKSVQDYGIAGLAIAIVEEDSVTFANGYGVADTETGRAVTTHSLFNIASCSKAMTAACLAILVDEDKLSWSDKVIDYIPDLQLSDPYINRELNIIDILSHRSGFKTFDGDLLWYGTDYTNKEIIHRMRHLPVTRDFRSQFGYQNNMYMIAGEIIEKVSGLSWAEFIAERIFKPLGMTDSRSAARFLEADQDIAYPHLEKKKYDFMFEEPHAAGSVFSSVNDMSQWIRMLLDEGKYTDERLLRPRTVFTLFAPQTILGVSQFQQLNGTHFHAYGLGWFLFDYAGKKIVEHDGGMPGYISKVTLVPEEKIGFVILTNDMNGLPGALRYKILDMFFNDSERDWAAEYLGFSQNRDDQREQQKKERAAKRAKNTKPSLKLQGYTGKYEDKMYGPATVELQNNKLVLTLEPTKELFTSAMEHWHYNTFHIKFKDEFLPEGFVTFRFTTDGEISGFTIDLPNPDFHFDNLDFEKLN